MLFIAAVPALAATLFGFFDAAHTCTPYVETPTQVVSIHTQDCARQPRYVEYDVAADAEHVIIQGCSSEQLIYDLTRP